MNIAFCLAIILGVVLICRPTARLWDHSIAGHCGNGRALEVFSGIFNLILDFSIVMIPMPIFWGSDIPLKKKMVLSLMFGMGIS